MAFKWGTHVSFLSKIRPKMRVSSTHGILCFFLDTNQDLNETYEFYKNGLQQFYYQKIWNH